VWFPKFAKLNGGRGREIGRNRLILLLQNIVTAILAAAHDDK
jgi:hypothetical protein